MKLYALREYLRGNGKHTMMVASANDPVEEIPRTFRYTIGEQIGTGPYVERGWEYHYTETRMKSPVKTVEEWCKEWGLI